MSPTCASGLFEARLGREEFGGEVHTFSAGYSEAQLREVLALSDHVVFNSLSQWQRFRALALEARTRRPELVAPPRDQAERHDHDQREEREDGGSDP